MNLLHLRRTSAAAAFAFFVLPASTLAQSSLWSADGSLSGDRFGLVVSPAGDINGDLVPDLVVGAPNADFGGSDSGRAWVLSGVDGSVLFAVDGAAAGDSLGFSAAGAGDVDADGVPDIIAGSRFNDTAGSDFGSAVVVSGATGLPLFTFFGPSSNSRFGEAVGAAGDVNNDGYDDVVVGARLEVIGLTPKGAARVYSGFDGSLLYTFEGTNGSDFFGRAVGRAGDVNADGYDDILVGAPGDDDGGNFSGSVSVFSGLDGSLLLKADGDGPSAQLGTKVDTVGDVNGDGNDDFIAGAPRSNLGGSDRGAALVYSGADGSVLFTFTGSTLGGEFGSAVASAGDTNGDGRTDFIVGARLDVTGGVNAGSASIFSGFDGALLFRLAGKNANDQFGDSAVGAGDLNGDGFDDLFIGSFLAGGVGRAEAFSGLDTLGDSICGPAIANSTGASARIIAQGSDVASDLDLTLTVTQLPVGVNGYFLTSPDAFTIVGPGGSAGNLCIASAAIGRYAGNVLLSNAGGTVSLGIDLGNIPGPSATSTVMAGETRYWQFWYRDMPSSNFSDAVGVTFQ